MNKTLISLSIAAAMMAGAHASEFDGSYVGGKVGANRVDTTGNAPTGRASRTTQGLEGGHNWDLDGLLVGVSGFYDHNNKGNHSAPLGTTANYGSRTAGADLKLGLPSDKLMPYLKFGYGHVKGSGDLSGTGKGALHAGLGLEYKLAPNWSLGGEWTTIRPREDGTRLRNNNLTVNLNYYFGKTAVAVAAPAPMPAPAPVPAPVVEAPKPQPVEKCTVAVQETPVRIDGANFATASAKLKTSANAQLDQVVAFAKQQPNAGISVSGHTDNRGSQAYNQKLSLQRAESIKAWLVSQGVSAERISTDGFGFEQPLADNSTDAGRAQNRRVEVRYVLKEEKKSCSMQ